MKSVEQIISISHHRNGVSGEGFSVVLFKHQKQKMVGIVFEGSGRCAILGVNKLAKGDIKFGSNSWRGDHFEDELREALRLDEERAVLQFYGSETK